MARVLVALTALVGLVLAPTRVLAQPTQKLFSLNKSGDITTNGGSVEMLNTGGLGTLRVQSSGTYTGTWEVQCSAAPAGATPVYDADDEVNLSLEGASAAAVQSVTDAVALYKADISGCTAVKVITTSAMTGTLTIYLSAISTGGSSGGGGSSAAGTVDPTTPTSWGIAVLGTTTYTEATTPGVTIGAVRRDADTTLVNTTNEVAPLQVNAGGQLKVACITGCAAGTSDTDDASIAAGQSVGLQGGLTMAFDGSVWRRVTFGTAGTASAQVWTMQGIASMTPLQVTNPTVASASSYITARLSDGSNFLTASTDMTIGSAFLTTGPGVVYSYKDFDGSALPTTTNVGTEEEATPGAASIVGVQYVMPVTENGAATAIGVDDAAASTTGAAFVMGARADEASTDSVDEDDIGQLRMSLDRLLYTRQLDPCSGVAKQYLPIDIVTATTTEITASLAGASTHYYICSVALVTAGANNVAIVDDDSDNCASVTSGVMGGFGSAAEGFNLAANGGLTLGNGQGSIARTNGTNRVLCIITSAAVQLSGTITVVAAP